MNVGGFPRNVKMSRPSRSAESVGAAIVLGARESRVQGKGRRGLTFPNLMYSQKYGGVRASRKFQRCSARANGVNPLDGAGEERERDDDSDGNIMCRKANPWRARCRENLHGGFGGESGETYH